MTVGLLVGAALGVGLLLIASVWLWPSVAKEAVPKPPGRMRRALDAAGFHRVASAGFVVVCGIAAMIGFAIAQALFGVVALSAGVAIVAGWAPWGIVSWRIRRRRLMGRTLWPDIVDQLVSGARSGVALPDAVAALARTAPEGARSAFLDFEREYRASGVFGPASDHLKAALADPVADRIIETLKMAREVGGGELVPVLKALAASLREDAAVRAEIEARQSWTVGAARLGVAAPWVVLALLATRPEASAAYNSPAGAMVIVTGLVVSAVAYRVMLAVGRLPEERRWFA